MLQIRRDDIRLGQVYCLHLPGRPEPDLDSEDCPWVKPLLRGSFALAFIVCKKDGTLVESPLRGGGIKLGSVEPALEVTFIPAVQLKWDEVRMSLEDKKYVAYSPNGVMLVRLTGRNVHFRHLDGSPDTIGDAYDPLIYRPSRRRFTLSRTTLTEDPQAILREFADQQRCDVGEVVFTPCT